MDILPLFCDIDDFCRALEPTWHRHRLTTSQARRRPTSLAVSEVMTLLVLFHASQYRTCKHFYLDFVRPRWGAEFPGLPSYTRFVELIPTTLLPLCGYVQTRFGPSTGIAFIDSLPIRVCHNRRIHSHKVFAGLAQRGKSSMGWFFGFKLHWVINDCGALLGLRLTPGNVRRP